MYAGAGPSALRHRPGTIRANLNLELEFIESNLFFKIQRWLKVHGKSTRPKLTDEQKKQLKTCFELMDADGSGAIDADELQDAFELLGLDFSKKEIQGLLDEVDRDGSGECEYPEFVEIMTTSLAQICKEEEEGAGTEAGQGQKANVSFDLMATAYRRKRLMEGLMSGDADVQNQIVQTAVGQISADNTGRGGEASAPPDAREAGGVAVNVLGDSAGCGLSTTSKDVDASVRALLKHLLLLQRKGVVSTSQPVNVPDAVCDVDGSECDATPQREGLVRSAMQCNVEEECHCARPTFHYMKGRVKLPGIQRRWLSKPHSGWRAGTSPRDNVGHAGSIASAEGESKDVNRLPLSVRGAKVVLNCKG